MGEPDEGGVATTAVVGFAGVLLLVALACSTVLGAAVAHRRAQAAADLAALAAATAQASGGDGCTAAADVAAANGAELGSCAPVGSDVQVTVTVPLPRAVPGRDSVTARARAGPS